jgi:hypothetical protein
MQSRNGSNSVVVGAGGAYVVVRASVPKIILDDVFEQKDDIAHNVQHELEKVWILTSLTPAMVRCYMCNGSCQLLGI